ncbi:MAG: hypothetical protein ACLFUJ_15180, partial [Phycisphaerae bacterium]
FLLVSYSAGRQKHLRVLPPKSGVTERQDLQLAFNWPSNSFGRATGFSPGICLLLSYLSEYPPAEGFVPLGR